MSKNEKSFTVILLFSIVLSCLFGMILVSALTSDDTREAKTAECLNRGYDKYAYVEDYEEALCVRIGEDGQLEYMK